MRLPLKFLPRHAQQYSELIGAIVMVVFGIYFFRQYAAPDDLQSYPGFGAWVRSNAAIMPFLLASIAFLLGALGWLAIAAINIVSGSPFNYLIVDAQGVTYRNFWREARFSWKALGPFSAIRVSSWQGRSSQRRHWIVAETISGDVDGREAGTARGLLWSNPGGTLRIPAGAYLSGGFLAGTLDLSANDAAGWLEELRQLARNDHLESEELPPPPGSFRAPIEIDYIAEDAHAAPAKDAPTIER